jgi:hypothetical protein
LPEGARDAANTIYQTAYVRHAIRRAPPNEIVLVARATWQSAHTVLANERETQAGLLRDICGNPFRPSNIGRE